MAELVQGFYSVPPVTRTLLSATGLVTLPTLLGLISPYKIIFYLPDITKKLQLWKLVTPFFYAGTGLPALFNVFFLFKTSRDLEDGVFVRRSHDLAWSVILMCGGILGLNYPLKSFIFFRALLLALTHYWAQFSPEQPMNLYGFITLPSKYISYALLVLDLLQGGPPAAMQGLTGIISAHVLFYLQETYPRVYPSSPRYLDTPAWFKKYVFGLNASDNTQRRERNFGGGVTGSAPLRRAAPSSTTTGGSARQSSTNTASAATPGVNWGRGNRLG